MFMAAFFQHSPLASDSATTLFGCRKKLLCQNMSEAFLSFPLFSGDFSTYMCGAGKATTMVVYYIITMKLIKMDSNSCCCGEEKVLMFCHSSPPFVTSVFVVFYDVAVEKCSREKFVVGDVVITF